MSSSSLTTSSPAMSSSSLTTSSPMREYIKCAVLGKEDGDSVDGEVDGAVVGTWNIVF